MSSTDLTYVPQFDEVNGVLTVSQHLELVGRLTCSDLPDMFRRLEAILSIMGLQGKRDEQVKSLTGGELKRVSISIGLISKPSVLFLDEPTTGLDSTASYSIVKYLADIAKTTNIAIILTIHQPSGLVFEMLDDLMLLENGRVVYKGVLRDAQNYFSTLGFTNPHQVNPADYYLVKKQITY
jgi:ABC-type multidrug transport system ATPase subunit